jgi:hypothetical protein
MNKIYLDKLCEFSNTTYKNYKHLNIKEKDFDINEQITIIKQNFSLNEKGIVNKYNYIDLSTLVNYNSDEIYEQLVLLYPICFNIIENYEWYYLLNSLLIILNNEYLFKSNVIKKLTLETYDKTIRKKIIITDKLDDNFFEKISIIINITLLILTTDTVKIYNQNTDNKTKCIVIYKNNNEYYPIVNWSQKYFNNSDYFINYLLGIIELQPKVKKNNIHIIDTIKPNDFYEEVLTNDNYAVFVSEAIDNKENLVSSTSKKDDIKKKIKKNCKNIFVVNNEKLKENKIDNNSVFNETEKTLNINDIKKIKENLKLTSTLTELQAFAIKLSISIIQGATKTGKPKKKIKKELFDEINTYISNFPKNN